jgi:hypothetical protein
MRTPVALPAFTGNGKESVMLGRRFENIRWFPECLEQEAEALQDEARELRPGKEREALLRKARQLKTAAHINEWLTSPWLSPPR